MKEALALRRLNYGGLLFCECTCQMACRNLPKYISTFEDDSFSHSDTINKRIKQNTSSVVEAIKSWLEKMPENTDL